MNRKTYLANRMREVIVDGTFIAFTNFNHQLADVTWQQATTKIGQFNTLAALTFHINYYIAGMIPVFEGGTLDIRDKYSYDMSPIENEEQWKELFNTLLINGQKFAALVEAMPESQLDEAFADEKYGTYFRNIDAMIEHAYYHLGQVVLIKKMIAADQS